MIQRVIEDKQDSIFMLERSTQGASDASSSVEATVWSTGVTEHDREFLDNLERVVGTYGLRKMGVYRIPAQLKLSVAVPVYNELNTIREIISRIRSVPIPKEIILVDDGSTDGTRAILKEYENDPDIRVILHQQNKGKGAALHTAFAEATGDIVIVQDADLEYSPSEYPRLIQPIVDGRADVVYGSRFIGEESRIHLFWHRVANGILTLLSNFFTNLNLTDMETCYKIFRRDVIQAIPLKQNRFGFDPEVTAKIAKRKVRIYEIPISYNGRDYSEGKKIGIKDAFEALYCIVRYAIKD